MILTNFVRILRDPNFNTLSPFCLATSPATYNPTDLKRGIGILHELGEVRLQIRQYHTINRISSGHSYLNGNNVLKFGSRSILTSRLRSNEYILKIRLACILWKWAEISRNPLIDAIRLQGGQSTAGLLFRPPFGAGARAQML
jgi:hypothetical protein